MKNNYSGYKPSFKERLVSFLSGRNGIDAICYLLLGLYAVISLVNCFINSLSLWLFGIALILYMWFRVFSRNIYKRRMENEKFMAFWRKLARWFKQKRRAFKERKDYAFRKCPSCKSVLRLPRVKGKHCTKCPRCHTAFEVEI